jgi:hypothetical protein
VEERSPEITLAIVLAEEVVSVRDQQRRSRGKELGAILKWGQRREDNHPDCGTPQAIAVIPALTRQFLIDNGIGTENGIATLALLRFIAAEYGKKGSSLDVENVSAAARAQLMQCVAKILEDGQTQASGTDCCQDELRWIFPRHLLRLPVDCRRRSV